jgi:hypothetical protein
MFEALGWAFWPSPPSPLPPPLIPRTRGLWERGDSGARLWHPMAVDGQCEHFFCLPLNSLWERGLACGGRFFSDGLL